MVQVLDVIIAVFEKQIKRLALIMKIMKLASTLIIFLTVNTPVPESEKKKSDEDAINEMIAKDAQLAAMEALNDALGKRERKQKYLPGYDVDLYYRNALAAQKVQKCLIERPHKKPKLHDFQFFNKQVRTTLSVEAVPIHHFPSHIVKSGLYLIPCIFLVLYFRESNSCVIRR